MYKHIVAPAIEQQQGLNALSSCVQTRELCVCVCVCVWQQGPMCVFITAGPFTMGVRGKRGPNGIQGPHGAPGWHGPAGLRGNY